MTSLHSILQSTHRRSSQFILPYELVAGDAGDVSYDGTGEGTSGGGHFLHQTSLRDILDEALRIADESCQYIDSIYGYEEQEGVATDESGTSMSMELETGGSGCIRRRTRSSDDIDQVLLDGDSVEDLGGGNEGFDERVKQ